MKVQHKIHQGDCLAVLKTLESESVQTCVTSPPYFGLRDYGVPGQIGLESTPAEFVAKIVEVFTEVRRVLKPDGTVWLNLGDSYANDGKWGGHAGGKHVKVLHASPIGRNKRYAGLKPKDLIGIPWRVAFALQEAGWWLRQDIIWSKPNSMPESITDRCTKSHEYIFLLTKSSRYFYDVDAIKEPCVWDIENTKMPDGWDTDPGGHGSYHRNGRQQGSVKKGPQTFGGAKARNGRENGGNPRNGHRTDGQWGKVWESTSATRNKRFVWTVATQPMPDAHFATFPEKLIEPCILAGSRPGDTVLDPFTGAGTTGLVSLKNSRNFVGAELNPEYIEIAERRLREVQVKLF